MRFLRAVLPLLLALPALLPALRAQGPLAPPPQTHIAAIGTAPLRAPATAGFSPAASTTPVFATANPTGVALVAVSELS